MFGAFLVVGPYDGGPWAVLAAYLVFVVAVLYAPVTARLRRASPPQGQLATGGTLAGMLAPLLVSAAFGKAVGPTVLGGAVVLLVEVASFDVLRRRLPAQGDPGDRVAPRAVAPPPRPARGGGRPGRRVRLALAIAAGGGAAVALLYLTPGGDLRYPGALSTFVLAAALLSLYDRIAAAVGPLALLLLTGCALGAMVTALVAIPATGGDVGPSVALIAPWLLALTLAGERMLRVQSRRRSRSR